MQRWERGLTAMTLEGWRERREVFRQRVACDGGRWPWQVGSSKRFAVSQVATRRSARGRVSLDREKCPRPRCLELGSSLRAIAADQSRQANRAAVHGHRGLL